MQGGVFIIEGREMGGQGSNVRLGEQTEEDGIVHTGMREEVFILGREDGVTHDVRNLVIENDVPAFATQFDEDVTIRVVNVAHRGRLKANKAVQVGKVRTIEVNVESRAYREGHRKQNDSSED